MAIHHKTILRTTTAEARLRSGIRMRGQRGNPTVRRALIRYMKWLRANYDFPMRVPVYLFPRDHIITMYGEAVSASFFAPFDPMVEPFIRIATGDYTSMRRTRGRDSALASFIISLSHEVIHYRQWIETGNTWETGVVRKAVSMLRRYEKSVDHP